MNDDDYDAGLEPGIAAAALQFAADELWDMAGLLAKYGGGLSAAAVAAMSWDDLCRCSAAVSPAQRAADWAEDLVDGIADEDAGHGR